MIWNNLVGNKRVPSQEKDMHQSPSIAFESDYRRIVKSSSFRRLQDKTQVFPLERNDFVRTRLTHSLEVAMISRDICNEVIKKLEEKNVVEPLLKESLRLLECASLIHDIGNPPFGHFGENAIRIWFENNLDKFSQTKDFTKQQRNDYLKFEGNAQTIRVLTKLHDYNGSSSVGMRLSASVLDSIIKYIASSDQTSKESVHTKKVGYFYSEREVFHTIKEATKTQGKRHPLVFLLEAADDISYTFSDLEDGFNYNMFSIHDLFAYLDDAIIMDKYKIDDKNKEALMQRFLREYQGKTFHCASDIFVKNYDLIMEGTYTLDLFDDIDMHEIQIFHKLKQFCYEFIFQHPVIIDQELVGYSILTKLLDAFIPAVLQYDTKEINDFEDKLLTKIPASAFQLYALETKDVLSESDKNYFKLKIAIDFICGMTDGYARKVHDELFGRI